MVQFRFKRFVLLTKAVIFENMAWNPLQKKPSLCIKPALSQGLSTHMEDRELEMCFNNLQNLEDNCKKLYKEVKRLRKNAQSNCPVN